MDAILIGVEYIYVPCVYIELWRLYLLLMASHCIVQLVSYLLQYDLLSD